MSFESVVIGLDFSPALSAMGAWLRGYLAPSATITVVHANEPVPVPPFLRALVPADQGSWDTERRRLEGHVAKWCETNDIAGATIIVEPEQPHALIQRVARQAEADLVVIGAHRGNARPWRRLGSTAERLLRSAESSVLVVHGRPHGPPHTVLVAVDDVAVTTSVLSIAGALADRFDAAIHAVHVLSNAAYSHVLSAEAATAQTSSDAQARVASDVAAEALRWLRALWQHTMRHDRLTTEIPHGKPADEILAAAERVSADLIVIGRYGIGRVVPAVLGSVVGSVVHGARCPVLVVSDRIAA
jgi:nucleotide-binding universal stress UspA family protein